MTGWQAFWRAAIGTFTGNSIQPLPMGMLSGITPGATGEPPPRGTREQLKVYSQSPWIRAVVGRIADAMAAVEWELYVAGRAGQSPRREATLQRARGSSRALRIRQAQTAGDLRPVPSHLFLDVWAAGNEFQTGHGMRKTMQIHLETTGEAFLLKERNGLRAPIGLWPIPADWVLSTPTPSRKLFRMSFRGWQVEIPDTEVLWITDPDPSNPYGRGTGLVRALGDEIETDEYAAKTTRQWFFNRALPPALIMPTDGTSTLSQPETKRFEFEWLARQAGFWKAFKPMFLSRKVDIHEFQGMDFRSQQFVQLREHERDIILHTFGVPPEILGVLENSNRATIESAAYLFAQFVLVPRLEFLRAAMQERLIPEYDPRLILDYVSPVPEDQAYALEAGKVAPWSRRTDEWRAVQHLDPLEDGTGQGFMVPIAVSARETLDPVVAPPVPLPSAPSPSPPPALAATAVPTTRRKILEEDLSSLARLAARLEPAFRRVFLEAAAAARGQVNVEGLAQAMLSGRLSTADLEAAFTGLSQDLAQWAPVLQDGFERGAQEGAQELESAGISMRFDVVNPQAITWAQRYAGALITQVDELTRIAIRDLVVEAVAGQRDVSATARLVREVIGLTGRQVGAIETRLAAWVEEGLSGETLWVRVGRLADSYLKQRGELIARTEILTAAHQGQRELWQQATQAGLLDPATTRRVWIVTDDDRLDPDCEALDGAEAELTGTFPGGSAGPPLHPACRCTTGLVFGRTA